MKRLTWSLRALMAAVLVMAASLAALRNPTADVAFAAGLALTGGLLIAIALAVGASGALRSSCTAFVIVSLLVLHVNDSDRKFLTALPPFSRSAAEWLNERFAWAEWKGPPKTWVYWSSGSLVRYVAFNEQGRRRSEGYLDLPAAERYLGGQIDLKNLPDDCPFPQPSLSALRDIVRVVSAVVAGVIAALLAQAAAATSRGTVRPDGS